MKVKRYLSIIICLYIFCTGIYVTSAEVEEPETLVAINAENPENNIGNVQTSNLSSIDGKSAYNFEFYLGSPNLFYLPYINSTKNMNTEKKYIFHAEYYPDFDTPTGYIDGLYLNQCGTTESGLAVTNEENSHPSNDDYRYYSYYYKNDYTDLYTLGFFNGYISDDLSASGSGDNLAWPWKTNEIVLETKKWNTFEMVYTKPDDRSFEIYPYVHTKWGNNISGGESVYADNVYLQELCLNKINLKKNNNSINNTTVNTKQDFNISFFGEALNQFDSDMGFKDKDGRVMEPLKFEIYDESGKLISTSAYGTTSTNKDIYVETEEISYKLKAPKDSKTTWNIPTYNFKLITSTDVPVGSYTVKASLLNNDIFGSENTAEFALKVLPKYSYTNDETEPETLIALDADNSSGNIGNFQAANLGSIDGKPAYDLQFFLGSTDLFYLPNIGSSLSMNTEKKYIFHADYYPDFDTPTGKIEGLYLNPSGTDIEGTFVSPKTNMHPSKEDYRYYSYYYKNGYTDLYTTGFLNGFINDDLSVSDKIGWPFTTNEIVLETKKWNTFEMLCTKPSKSAFDVFPYVHTKWGNNISGGESVYVDDAYFQELALKKINLIKNDNTINDTILKTKQNYDISFFGEVINQFDTDLGFKDKNGRVMEPLKFEIYNEKGDLVSTSAYGIEPTNNKIYVETEVNSYKLKAPKNSKTTWDTPTYDFKLITTEDVEVGNYTVKASLLNKDVFGSEQITEFTVEVLSKDSYTNDETEPETLLWLNGEQTESVSGNELTISENNGKNQTNGYVFDFAENESTYKSQKITSASDRLMNPDKKYIYKADYYLASSSATEIKIDLNGVKSDLDLPENTWYSYEKLIDKNIGNDFTASHLIANNTSAEVYADNIKLQELSLSQINLSATPKVVTRNHEFDFSLEPLNQFGTKTGFCDENGILSEPFEFKVYSSAGNLMGESKYIENENCCTGSITVSAKTKIQSDGILKPTGEFTVHVADDTVSETYIVKASLLNKNIHNSSLTNSFEFKVIKEKDYPNGAEHPDTLLWANGDDAYCGFGYNLATPVYNKGVGGSNAYKQSIEYDNGACYLKPFPYTAAKTDPSKKYIYHADYFVDFETANKTTTTNWMLWSSASEDGKRVTSNEGEAPSNEDYRYYSYYPGFPGTDVYIKGVFNGTINPDLTMAEMGWPPVSNMFVLKSKEWTTYEALISKQEFNQFYVYGLLGKSNDDAIGKPVYIDNVALQELALGDIKIYNDENEISKGNVTAKRGDEVSFTAEVYNQFGTTLGFKDRDGRVMEPLEFVIYDENGNEISDSRFELESQEKPFGMFFETKRNEYILSAPKNGMDKWVYPTYDFTLNVSDKIPCGMYKVKVKLQNDDIFGSEKTSDFNLTIIENSSEKDFNIFGASEIFVPVSEDENVTYTHDIGDYAVWSLDKKYSGIFVSDNGVLTVKNTASQGEINLICENNINGEKYVSSKQILISRKSIMSLESNDLYKVKIADFDYTSYQKIMNFFGENDKFLGSEIIPKNVNESDITISADTKKVNLFVWDDNMKPYSSVINADTKNLPVNIYVSLEGDDENAGTLEKPLKTFEAARDKIRSIKSESGYPVGGINVIIRGGDYHLTKSFELEKCDSGIENAPIVYKAFGDEKVTINGGDTLPYEKWSLVTDANALSKIPSDAHGKVYEMNLSELGYTADDIGKLNYWGIFSKNNHQSKTDFVPVPAELYCDNEPQVLARYPNDGYIYVKTVYEPGAPWYDDKSEDIPFEIGYEDMRTERWLNAKYAKLFGYWMYDYAESSVDIDKIDTEKKSIKVKQSVSFGVKAHEPDKIGGRYYILNLLEELDSPGEYYTDLDTMKIYYYPKGELSKSDIKLSMLNNQLFSVSNLSNVTFEGIDFAVSKDGGIWLTDCTNVNIKGCELCNFGDRAVTVWEGTNNCVSDCKIYNSNGGIELRSYDGRESLIKSNNSAVNNEIYNFSRTTRSSMPAITVDGCGNYVAKNCIHDSPSTGIWLLGANENIVEYNEIYDVITDTSDAGAIYCGADWSERGNIIRYNHIYGLGSGQVNLQGIYLDGTVSGYDIYSNIIGGYYGIAVLINGGHDVSVHNNIFYDCSDKSMLMRYVPSMFDSMADNLVNSSYRNDIWKEKYPHLYTMLETDPYLPRYSFVNNNIAINCVTSEIHDLVKELGDVENVIDVSSEQVSVFDKNGKLNPDFRTIKTFIPDFEEFDFSNIGSTIVEK